MKNPLLEPYSTAPFSRIKTTHFLPAIKQLIKDTQEEIDSITNQSDEPTFDNTVVALDFTGLKLDRATSIFFNLNSAETNDEIQKIAQELSPLLSDFKNDLLLNESLFKRVRKVYQQQKELDLNTEQLTLLERQYKGFSRNGAQLSNAKKETLRKIDSRLSKLKLTFGENVLAETNDYELHITKEEDLSGLPEGFIEMAAQTAKDKEKNGWIITLDYPSYVPFMTYADNRDLREKIAIAFGARGFQNNKYDNQENVLEIVTLRHDRAVLLGYASHAHFILEERMAGSSDNVFSFLEELLDKTKSAAEAEFKELESFAKDLDGIDHLEKWDGAYYAEKLKQQKFQLDDELLKPYFMLENVIDGVLKFLKNSMN